MYLANEGLIVGKGEERYVRYLQFHREILTARLQIKKIAPQFILKISYKMPPALTDKILFFY